MRKWNASHGIRPNLDQLEDRTIPAIFTYSGTEAAFQTIDIEGNLFDSYVIEITDQFLINDLNIRLDHLQLNPSNSLQFALLQVDGSRENGFAPFMYYEFFPATPFTEFVQTEFDDSSSDLLGSASPPYTGSFAHDISFPLEIFEGKNSAGRWALTFLSHTPANIVNLEWSLIIEDGFVDQVPPTLQFSGPSQTNQIQSTFQLAVSEPIIGLTESDFQISGGRVVPNSLQSLSPTLYQIQLEHLSQGAISIMLPSGAITDLGNNPNALVTTQFIYDLNAPTATIVVPSQPTVATSVPITIQFSEAINGFDETDLQVQNGYVEAGTFQMINPSFYVARVAPTVPGTVRIEIPESSYEDLVGNSGHPVSVSFVYEPQTPVAGFRWEIESNDSLIMAEVLSSSINRIQGQIPSADVDYFKIESVQLPGTLVFEVVSETFIELDLLDTNGNIIASSHQQSPKIIHWLQSGDFYIRLKSSNPGLNSYLLKANLYSDTLDPFLSLDPISRVSTVPFNNYIHQPQFGDFNGDGLQDMVVSSNPSNPSFNFDLNIWYAVEGGGYQDVVQLSVTRPRQFWIVDINQDGYSDLFLLTQNAQAFFYLGSSVGLNVDDIFNGQNIFIGSFDPISGDYFSLGRHQFVPDSSEREYISIGSSKIAIFNVDQPVVGNPFMNVDVRVIELPATMTQHLWQDINHDGLQDIVFSSESNFYVYLQDVNRSFLLSNTIATSSVIQDFVLADFNDDDQLDFAYIDKDAQQLWMVFGQEGGVYSTPVMNDRILSFEPIQLEFADVNGDRHMDLIVLHQEQYGAGNGDNPNYGGSITWVLLNNGNGGFVFSQELLTGTNDTTYGDEDPLLRLADFNQDGWIDFVHLDTTGKLQTYVNRGDGTYQLLPGSLVHLGGGRPAVFELSDFNQDHFLDVITSIQGEFSGNYQNAPYRIRYGNGDGTFAAIPRLSSNSSVLLSQFADFDQNGIQDLVTSNSVLLLGQDGNVLDEIFFPEIITFRGGLNVGSSTEAVILSQSTLVDSNLDGQLDSSYYFADFNRDGRMDIAAIDSSTGHRILLGYGDGSFQLGNSIPITGSPAYVQFRDINADNILDISYQASAGIYYIYGVGDGNFLPPALVPNAIRYTSSEKLFDINSDSILDRIVYEGFSFNSNVLNIQILNTDRQLISSTLLTASQTISGFHIGDLNQDSHADLVLFLEDGTLHSYLGAGNGSFTFYSSTMVPFTPLLPTVGTDNIELDDLNEDGHLDIVASYNSGFSQLVYTWFGDGSGAFNTPQLVQDIGFRSFDLKDLSGDGLLDLVLSSSGFLPAIAGSATYGAFISLPTENGVAATDLNLDGRMDLVTPNNVYFQSQDGVYVNSPTDASDYTQNIPVFFDLNQDGLNDSLILASNGDLLFRQGLPGNQNLYLPPVVLNRNQAWRDFVVLNPTGITQLAALHQSGDHISIFQWQKSGLQLIYTFATESLQQKLYARDLDQDGHDELITLSNRLGSLSIYDATSTGWIRVGSSYDVGFGSTDLELMDLNSDSLLDLIVTNRSSGQITNLLNQSTNTFVISSVHATNHLPHSSQLIDSNRPRSFAQPVSSTLGQLNADDFPDLAIVHRNLHQIQILIGNPDGSFQNPQLEDRIILADGTDITFKPGQIHPARLTSSNRDSLLVLVEDLGELWIYQPSISGYSLQARHSVGLDPTGLTLYDYNQDGILDIAVGNRFGDLLFLEGYRNTITSEIQFREFIRVDQRVTLVAGDYNQDGKVDVALADQAYDLGKIYYRNDDPSFRSNFTIADDRSLIGPGDILYHDINSDGFSDLLFANTGSNNVLLYLGHSTGFAQTPLSFFVGTGPTKLRLAQLNDDNRDSTIDSLDRIDLLVANSGSNDISILYGTTPQNGYLQFGPRLETGGQGPIDVIVQDTNQDGIADLLVTHAISQTQTTILGLAETQSNLATGFFEFTPTVVANLPVQPIRVISTPNSPSVTLLAIDGSIWETVVTSTANFTPRLLFAPRAELIPFTSIEFIPPNPTLNRPTTLVGIDRAGFVTLLRQEAGVFQVESRFATGVLNLSDLEVVIINDNLIDIYLGSSGSDPFVYSIEFADLIFEELIQVPFVQLNPTLITELTGTIPSELIITLVTGIDASLTPSLFDEQIVNDFFSPFEVTFESINPFTLSASNVLGRYDALLYVLNSEASEDEMESFSSEDGELIAFLAEVIEDDTSNGGVEEEKTEEELVIPPNAEVEDYISGIEEYYQKWIEQFALIPAEYVPQQKPLEQGASQTVSTEQVQFPKEQQLELETQIMMTDTITTNLPKESTHWGYYLAGVISVLTFGIVRFGGLKPTYKSRIARLFGWKNLMQRSKLSKLVG